MKFLSLLAICSFCTLLIVGCSRRDNSQTPVNNFASLNYKKEYKNNIGKHSQPSVPANNSQTNASYTLSEPSSNKVDDALRSWDSLSKVMAKQYIEEKEQYYNHQEPNFFSGKVYRYGSSVKYMLQTAKEFYKENQSQFNNSQNEKLNSIYSRLDILRQQINSDIGENRF